ncbi:hypothetical protein ACFQGE_02515 [Halomicroarcula sp. GCM10025817]|nr:hypothetical protein [Halomicroarcula sp. SYNS111]
MATNSRSTTLAYRCPDCNGAITFDGASWGCTDCRYVPRHSAD